MMKLAELLHSQDFHITFVHTEYNHRRLIKSVGPAAVDGLPDFQFKTIPDGLPPSDGEANPGHPYSLRLHKKDLLTPLLGTSIQSKPFKQGPPVSCIVSDGVMSFTLDAAEEIGVPEVLFWTTSACGFMGYLQSRELIRRGIIPLKDESYLTNGYLDMPLEWVPGMPNIRLKDLPNFVRTTNPDEFMVNYNIEQTDRASRAAAIVLNTFESLEGTVLKAMTDVLPPVYAIGPLSFLLQQPSKRPRAELSSSLWKEDESCLKWLDSRKKPGAVIYVNFGSITVMTTEQLMEFAWGLASSDYEFLWIIRPDLLKGETAILPEEFLKEVEDRGKLANWCPQEKVLAHPSVGGFLTHSGWNSTIESISAGVPMLCWPFFAEQQTNCRYACAEWGIGMEIDGDVKREKVRSLILELMEGEKGKEMKRRASQRKEQAAAAANSGGTSSTNLGSLLRLLKAPAATG